jgi:hypothetical protein
MSCEEAVENVPLVSAAKPNPVMAVAEMGETAMSPVMIELGTEEIPLLARIA